MSGRGTWNLWCAKMTAKMEILFTKALYQFVYKLFKLKTFRSLSRYRRKWFRLKCVGAEIVYIDVIFAFPGTVKYLSDEFRHVLMLLQSVSVGLCKGFPLRSLSTFWKCLYAPLGSELYARQRKECNDCKRLERRRGLKLFWASTLSPSRLRQTFAQASTLLNRKLQRY